MPSVRGDVGCRVAARGEPLPRPSSVEADKLGAMGDKDVSGNGAPLAFWREGHDHKPSGADVLDVVHQVLVLLDRPSRANQCPLQPLE
jgi:hypothetical protein